MYAIYNKQFNSLSICEDVKAVKLYTRLPGNVFKDYEDDRWRIQYVDTMKSVKR